MRFDRSHLIVLCVGLGLGTILHFVDWQRVRASTESLATAAAGVSGLISGLALALKGDPKELMAASDSFKIKNNEED